ncbi:MAG: RNA 2',3'-cyclic phosphodiesterase [Flavobacteriales bacterium]|nr:RNA 2',3'-cyclic phosphodiesterase [Flavobacteriales bacterium]
MKLFTGIELSVDFVVPFSELKLMNKHLEGIKWTRPESYHITTYYLGETSPLLLNNLLKKIEKVASRNKSISLDFKKFGFSPGKNPSMLWAYFKLNFEFQKLCNEISTAADCCMPSRFKPVPHISIARLKKPHRFYQPIFDVEIPKKLTAKKVHLWQSKIGGRYDVLQSFNLVG